MAEPIRVLLVDDEPDFQETIAFWLTAKGYQVSKARSGQDALAILKENHQDVVFLDVNMPVMDGIETLRRIRAINKSLPVILVTASNLTDENQYAGAKALGISGLFPKGSDLTQLTEVLQVALRRLRRADPAASVAPAPQNPPASANPSSGILRKLFRKLFPPAR